MAALALCAPCALADINLPTVPPPQPQAISANVHIGESVEIPLSAVSRSGGGLQFFIRRQPSAGTLSAIRMTGPKTAIVTYTHTLAAGQGVDRFRYAVSAQGIGVSTPAEVIVNITERPPVFVAPARLDFPDASVGQSLSETIELRNDGGGRIEGRLVVPVPWTIDESGDVYSLGPGETATLTVHFAPTEARYYSATAQFSHAAGVELGLAGGGYNPVEVVPREIRLETDGRSEVRSGGFLVRNVSANDRELRIVAPPEVVVQDTIRSPAQSETQVAVHTLAGFLGALDGRIKITSDGVSFEVPLRVMPAPARLTVAPKTLDFGTLDSGRTGRARIKLRNAGGMPAKLTVKLPAGTAINPDPARVPLEPGASQEFEIRLARPLAGGFSDSVAIEAADSSVRIPLQATIRQSWNSDNGEKSAAAAAPAQQIVYSEMPPVMQIGVTRQTKTELDLTWEKAPDAAKYLLFLRTIAFGEGGRTQFKYQRLDRVKVRFVRKEARATLAGLRPGESVTLHVVGYDSEGLPSPPSPPFTVATKPSPVFRIPWLWIGLLLLAACVVLIVRERRRRRAASDAEVASLGRV